MPVPSDDIGSIGSWFDDRSQQCADLVKPLSNAPLAPTPQPQARDRTTRAVVLVAGRTDTLW